MKLKFKSIIIFFVILFVGLYGSEKKYWERTFGGTEREIGWSVQVTGDGGCIIGGLTHSFGAGQTDYYLIKVDSEGNMEWQRTFGTEKRDMSIHVQNATDQGYILCGTTGYGSDNSDIYVVKTDSNGILDWEKTYGGEASERGGCIRPTADGGYIVCGTTSSYRAGDSDIYLLKISSTGERDWEKTYGGSGRDWSQAVQITSDDGIIIGGNTASYGQGKQDVYLIKTDHDGNKEWEKTYGGPENEFIFGTEGLIQAEDGGFVFCTYGQSFGEGMTDCYVVKTDSSGDIEWEKTFGGAQDDGALSVLQMQDSGYLICGYTKSTGAGDRDVYLVKIDQNGNKEWEKTFGGPGFDCGIAIQMTNDGGLIICGETASYGSGERDVYLIKTDLDEKY